MGLFGGKSKKEEAEKLLKSKIVEDEESSEEEPEEETETEEADEPERECVFQDGFENNWEDSWECNFPGNTNTTCCDKTICPFWKNRQN